VRPGKAARKDAVLKPATPKPILFISVSIGWVIRNFFQTGVIEKLKAYFEIVVVATPKACASIRVLGHDQGVRLIPVDVGDEPTSWKALRQMRKKVYLEGRDSSSERIWEKYYPRPRYQRIGSRVLKGAMRFADGARLYRLLDGFDLAVNRCRRFDALFREYRPELFFATHATSYFEECLLRNACAAGVPAVFMILSWDHLSSKILLNRKLHAIMAWNHRTKSEILDTYRSFRPEQVRVVGIPQYDLYATPPDIDYSGWCRRYGLDPGRRTILFSTMPQSRHDQQHLIIEELLKAIGSGGKIPSDLQILIKCHPFDNFKGYDVLLNHYPVAIYCNSFDETQTQEDWIPAASEIEASRDALFFCSLNINIFSTVTIEAAYFDKPIVQIAFDPLPVQNRIPCREYYNWDHFKPIVETGATTLVHGYDELFEAINLSLDDPRRLAPQRKMLVDQYVGKPIGTAVDACAREIERLHAELAARRGNRDSLPMKPQRCP
jgi:hypothetical protein